MKTQHWRVTTWAVSETWWKCIYPCHRLKTYVLFWVNFSNLLCNNVIEFLQMNLFRNSGNHNHWLFVHISRPWLVYNLIRYYIWIIFEVICNFFPIICKFVSQAVLIFIQLLKSFIDRISCIELSPLMARTYCFIFLGNRWKRKWKFLFQIFGSCPGWYSCWTKWITK